jgi:hypothetical protein
MLVFDTLFPISVSVFLLGMSLQPVGGYHLVVAVELGSALFALNDHRLPVFLDWSISRWQSCASGGRLDEYPLELTILFTLCSGIDIFDGCRFLWVTGLHVDGDLVR